MLVNLEALRSDLVALEHFVILESIEYVVQYFACVLKGLFLFENSCCA